MNRQQQRRVHKLTGKELREMQSATTSEAVNFTLKTVYKVMGEEFGFGEKRLGRLGEGITREMEGV